MTKEKLNRQAVAAALADTATFATILHVVCILSYGEEIYNIEPMELYLRLEEDYHAKLSQENENRLQAILLATATDAFYEDERAFRATVNTLLDGEPGFDTFDDLTLEEIFWAIYEVELNHDEEAFSPVIEALIEREIREEGEEPDDYNGIEEFRPNYVVRALADYRRKLGAQLKAIGVKDVVLPPVA